MKIPARRPRRLSWASLMKRVLDVDALSCPKCHVPMVVLAFLTDPDVIQKILKHLELPTASPPLLPDRCAVEEFDQCIDFFAADNSQHADHVSPGHNRCQRPRPARPPP